MSAFDDILDQDGVEGLFDTVWRLRKAYGPYPVGHCFYVDDSDGPTGAKIIAYPIPALEASETDPLGPYFIWSKRSFRALFDTSRQVADHEAPVHMKIDDMIQANASPGGIAEALARNAALIEARAEAVDELARLRESGRSLN